jgi:hypothetical protein
MDVKKLTLLLILFSLLFIACKKDQETVSYDNGYAYFPVTTGSYVVYDVDSIRYDDFKGTIDTFKFELKEVIESEYLDNSDRNTLRIERYKKFPGQSWVLTDVWSANRNASNAEKVEENVRYVKLSFPITKSKKWNGNAFNSEGEMEYKYSEVHSALTIGSLSFDSTITVQQEADSNLIEKRVKTEIYAKNVGLVSKRYIDVACKDSVINFNLPFDKRITTGVKVTYTIKDFGK